MNIHMLIIPLEKLSLIILSLFVIFKRIGYRRVLRFFWKGWKELLFILFISVSFLPFLKSFATIDDWNQFICAKSFISWDEELFNLCPSYGYTYPSFAYFSFLLFGTSQTSLIIFHFLIFFLTLLFLFFSSHFLFEDRIIALSCVLLLASMTYFLRGSFVFRNRNTVAILFIFLTLAFISYGIQKKDRIVYLLSLPSLFLGIGVKYELLNLIYPSTLLYLYVFRENLKRSLLVFLMFLGITILLNLHTFTFIKSFYSPHLRREPLFFYREKVENWVVRTVDRLIKASFGPNFSLGFLPKNISAFLFHLRNRITLFLLITISSILTLYKRKYLEFLVPFSFSFFLSFTYLFYYVPMHEMFFTLMVSPMFILSGYLLEIRKMLNGKELKIFTSIFLTLLLVYEFVNSYNSFVSLFRVYMDNPYYKIQDEKYSKLIEKHVSEDSTLIVGHEQVMLNFKFYLPRLRVLSLYLLMNDTQIISSYENEKPLSFYCVELNYTDVYVFQSEIDPKPVKKSFECILSRYNSSIVYEDDISSLRRLLV